jgi:hypothetical protein
MSAVAEQKSLVPNKFLFYIGYNKETDLYFIMGNDGYKMNFISESEARSFQQYKNDKVLDSMFDYAYEGECSMENPFFANYQFALRDAKEASVTCLVGC